MRPQSELRNRRLWEARRTGLPQYQYYVDVWERWCRMFGPEIFMPPLGEYEDLNIGLTSKTAGRYLLWQSSQECTETAKRIARAISQNPSRRAYWSAISSISSDFLAVYVNGNRCILDTPQKAMRFVELYFIWQILARKTILDDIQDGIGKMID